MNFDFSEATTSMRAEVQNFLADRLAHGAVRRHVESGEAYDQDLWAEMAAMGWLGAAMPEDAGGAALGYETLCMLAEEIGRALAPVPFASTLYFGAEALMQFGDSGQKARWLPGIADGSVRACLALAEGAGEPAPAAIETTFDGGVLHGRKWPVFDGGAADIAIVAARGPASEPALYLVELAGVTRQKLNTLDLGGSTVELVFEATPAMRLPGARGWKQIMRLLDRAAILFAFEQVGGARAALDMAVSYAKERFAFGRPIASQQAIKHQLADIYVAIELARSNAYFGAWALEHDSADLSRAAAAARISATAAYERAAIQNIQTHGGMGFTWESDCHLFHRRAKRLSGQIGSARFWRNRLIGEIIPMAALPPAGGGLCPPAPPTGVTPASLVGTRPTIDAGGTPVGVQGAKPPVAEGETTERHRMDFGDTPEEAAFRIDARAFLESAATLKEAGPRVYHPRGLDAADIEAAKGWQAHKAAAGFAGLHWPREYGGRGGTQMQTIIYGQEEARFDVPPGVFNLGIGMALPTIMKWGQPGQAERFAPPALRGAEIWCQLFSEPAAGSDLAGLRTRAVRAGDEWMINGQKIWTSNAHFADFGLLLTRTNAEARKHEGLTCFILDMRTPGVEIRRIRQISGTSNFCEVFFGDVRIPDTRRVGGVGDGWKVALTVLGNERFVVGQAEGPDVEDILEFARSIDLDGKPALEDAAVREKITDWYVQAEGLKYTRLRMQTALSRGEVPGPEASIAKLVSATKLQQIAGFGVDLLGQAGAVMDAARSPLNAWFQEAVLYAPGKRIAGGTDEILRNIIAERVLGMPSDARADKDIPFNQIPGAAS